MRYLKYFTILAIGAILFGTLSCSSDKSDEPISETSTTVALRNFCKRYSLPEDKILQLHSPNGISKNSIGLFTAINDLNEAVVIICDTIENKALYTNFNLIKIDKEIEFSLPYGEKGTFQFSHLYLPDFATNGNNIAAAIDATYVSSNSNDGGVIHYRLFYTAGRMSVIKLPQALETQHMLSNVISWYDGGSLFYYQRDRSNPQSKLVTCYDNKGNLCYEAQYPYFYDDVNQSVNIFESSLLQSTSIAECIVVNLSQGKITVSSVNIQDHLLLWQKKDIAIESYEYKNDDRVSLTNKSFSNGVLSFTVEITTFSGSKASYNVAITSDGEVTFPK